MSWLRQLATHLAGLGGTTGLGQSETEAVHRPKIGQGQLLADRL
jgi:hypothetical protein